MRILIAEDDITSRALLKHRRSGGRPLDYWFTNNFMYDIQIIYQEKPV
jgi:hypothetical protein